MKRYWYVIFALIILGVLLFGFMFFKNDEKADFNPFRFISDDREEESAREVMPNPNSKVGDGAKMQDKDGKVHTNITYFKGFVQSWKPESGTLDLKDSLGKSMTYTISPEGVVIFTPVVGNKNRLLMLKNRESIHWKSGFCAGDLVTVTFDGKQMVSVSNDGDRSCGFKGAEQ